MHYTERKPKAGEAWERDYKYLRCHIILPFDSLQSVGVSYCRNHDGEVEGSCWFFAAVALCARLYERHGCVLFDLSCMFPAVGY